jgi:hypothetical protein
MLLLASITLIMYTRNPFTTPERAKIACEFGPTPLSAFVIAVVSVTLALDCIVCNSVGDIRIEPVKFWYCAIAACSMYVHTKIPIIVGAVMASTVTVIMFLFLFVILYFLTVMAYKLDMTVSPATQIYLFNLIGKYSI